MPMNMASIYHITVRGTYSFIVHVILNLDTAEFAETIIIEFTLKSLISQYQMQGQVLYAPYGLRSNCSNASLDALKEMEATLGIGGLSRRVSM
jgi:hypothetical protein